MSSITVQEAQELLGESSRLRFDRYQNREKYLVAAARQAKAALTQNATHPADVRLARESLRRALDAYREYPATDTHLHGR